MTLRSTWREATGDHRRWLLLNTILIAAVANAVLNALIAWLTTLGEDEIPLAAVPLVEGPSVITDTVGTFFVLTFLTTLVITKSVRRELREGKLEPVRSRWALAERLPERPARRGLKLGLACMAALGPPAVAILIATDFGDIGIGEFVLYKAIFGVALGALVTPPVALAALADGYADREPSEEGATAEPQRLLQA